MGNTDNFSNLLLLHEFEFKILVNTKVLFLKTKWPDLFILFNMYQRERERVHWSPNSISQIEKFTRTTLLNSIKEHFFEFNRSKFIGSIKFTTFWTIL